jgi:hypothetical protein
MKKIQLIIGITGFVGACVLFLAACQKNGDVVNTEDSFALIQSKILTPSCAKSGCHSSTSDNTFAQHGLVLSGDVAYDNLVNKAPKNAAALADGMSLVKPYQSAKSLLFHKVECDRSHHSSSYGATMPLGGTNLSNGAIEFIRRWIEAGAPKTGNVVDVSLLNDNVPCNSNFTPLAAPPAGQGFQLVIDRFAVNANFEREVFIRRAIPNTSTVFVNRLQTKGRANSHHFVVYGFNPGTPLPNLDEMRDLRLPNGTVNLQVYSQINNEYFIYGGTDVNQDYTFPAGVALRVPTGFSVDLNSHNFNTTNSIVYGENYLNLYTTPAANVQHEAKTLDLKNTDISIPAGQRATFSKTFTFSQARKVFMLTSHYHKLGERFQIKIAGGARDGEVVYENTDWAHPLVKTFATPIQLQAGEGLTSVVTFNNTTNQTVAWGLTTADEMSIIFGYYY